ncbi:MAG: toxin-antitoxin system protein [Mangrovibacterium sp.]
MEATATRAATTIRLERSFLARLKEKAKQTNQSLNSYMEGILLDGEYYEPNAETIAAIEEARSGKDLEVLDLDNFRKYCSPVATR